ncbi:MAG: radical SAM protein, partial [Candidatus Omnitrophica bacterium]|nr:radical SAM protein [Candidatus Omnitrophota bacterium]
MVPFGITVEYVSYAFFAMINKFVALRLNYNQIKEKIKENVSLLQGPGCAIDQWDMVVGVGFADIKKVNLRPIETVELKDEKQKRLIPFEKEIIGNNLLSSSSSLTDQDFISLARRYHPEAIAERMLMLLARRNLAEKMHEATLGSDKEKIRKEFDKVVNEFNAYPVLQHIDNFQQAHTEWIEDHMDMEEAIEAMKEGKRVDQMPFAGQGSRMDNSLKAQAIVLSPEELKLSNLNIWQIAEIMAKQNWSSFNIASPAYRKDIGFGEREMFAAEQGILNLATDYPAQKITQKDIKEIRRNYKAIISISDDIEKTTKNAFLSPSRVSGRQFFGFNPENIVFVRGGYGPRFRLTSPTDIEIAGGKTSWNHGFAFIELAWIHGKDQQGKARAFTLDTQGNEIPLEVPVFLYMRDKGAEYGVIRRINDLLLLHPYTSIDINMFASFLGLRKQSQHKDINLYLEMMSNPTGQKGGLALSLAQSNLTLIEGLATKDPWILNGEDGTLDFIAEWALRVSQGKRGIPYNRLYGYYVINDVLEALVDGETIASDDFDMPLAISQEKSTPGYFAPEMPSGDLTWFYKMNALAGMRRYDFFIDQRILPNEMRDSDNNPQVNKKTFQIKKAYRRGEGAIIHDCKEAKYIKDGLRVVDYLDNPENKVFNRKYYSSSSISTVDIYLPDRVYEETDDDYGTFNYSSEPLPEGLVEELREKFGHSLIIQEWVDGKVIDSYEDSAGRVCTKTARKTKISVPEELFEEIKEVIYKYYPETNISRNDVFSKVFFEDTSSSPLIDTNIDVQQYVRNHGFVIGEPCLGSKIGRYYKQISGRPLASVIYGTERSSLSGSSSLKLSVQYRKYSNMDVEKFVSLYKEITHNELTDKQTSTLQKFFSKLTNLKSEADNYDPSPGWQSARIYPLTCEYTAPKVKEQLDNFGFANIKIVKERYAGRQNSLYPISENKWRNYTGGIHYFCIADIFGMGTIISLSEDQFVKPGQTHENLGIFIMPLRYLDQYSWPFAGGVISSLITVTEEYIEKLVNIAGKDYRKVELILGNSGDRILNYTDSSFSSSSVNEEKVAGSSPAEASLLTDFSSVDVDKIYSLEKNMPKSWRWKQKQLKEIIESEDNIVIFLTQKDSYRGYLVFSLNLSMLLRISVDNRGESLGSILLEELLEVLKERGVKDFTIMSVNGSAVFYEKFANRRKQSLSYITEGLGIMRFMREEKAVVPKAIGIDSSTSSILEIKNQRHSYTNGISTRGLIRAGPQSSSSLIKSYIKISASVLTVLIFLNVSSFLPLFNKGKYINYKGIAYAQNNYYSDAIVEELIKMELGEFRESDYLKMVEKVKDVRHEALRLTLLIRMMVSNRGEYKKSYKIITYELGQIGNEQAIKALIIALGYSTQDTQEYVVDSLTIIGKEATPYLLESFDYTGGDYVYKGIIKSLGSVGDKRAIQKLVEIAEDKIYGHVSAHDADKALKNFDDLLVKSIRSKYIKKRLEEYRKQLKKAKDEKIKNTENKKEIRKHQHEKVMVFVLDSDFRQTAHGGLVVKVVKSKCSDVEVQPIVLDKRQGVYGGISFNSYLDALKEVLLYAKNNSNHRVIMNISLGSYDYNYKEKRLIKMLLDEKVIIVAGAGNDGKGRLLYPAEFDGVIAVASATRYSKEKTAYSNWGINVDICAYAYTTFVNHNVSGYIEGTSFSVPRVVGVMAKMFTENPYLYPSEVISILKKTADNMEGKSYAKGYLGVGLMDEKEALEEAEKLLKIYSPHKRWKPIVGYSLMTLLFIGIGILVAEEKLRNYEQLSDRRVYRRYKKLVEKEKAKKINRKKIYQKKIKLIDKSVSLNITALFLKDSNNGVREYAKKTILINKDYYEIEDWTEEKLQRFFEGQTSSSPLTGNSNTNTIYANIYDQIQKMAQVMNLTLEHEAFTLRLEKAHTFLTQIAERLNTSDAGQAIRPQLANIIVDENETEPTPVSTVLRIGVYPIAGNPMHLDHLLVALQAIAQEGLDKIIFDIQGPKDERKPILKYTKDYRYELAKQELALFSPFFGFSENISADGETDIFRLMKLNPNQKIDWFYIVGGDHYNRWAKAEAPDNIRKGTPEYEQWVAEHGRQPKPDTIQKLEDNPTKLGMDTIKHSISALFAERPGEPQKDINHSLKNLKTLPPVGDASATAIREAFKGMAQGAKTQDLPGLVYLPYMGYEYIKIHSEYLDMLVNPEKYSSSAIIATDFRLQSVSFTDKETKATIKVLFVNLTSDIYPSIDAPLGLYTLKGYLDANFKGQVSSKILDMQINSVETIIEQIIKDKPDILGMSVAIGTLETLRSIVKYVFNHLGFAKKPLLVFGKSIPTFAPQAILDRYPNAICVLGEGELALKGLIEYLQGKSEFKKVPNIAYTKDGIVYHNQRHLLKDLSCLGRPDFSQLAKIVAVEGGISIEASRGCPWGKCTFCSGQRYFGCAGSWRARPKEAVIEDLKVLKQEGVRRFFFVDEEFFGPGLKGIERAKQLAVEIINNDIHMGFCINARVDSIYNPEDKKQERKQRVAALRLLKTAGLQNIFLGIESGVMTQIKRYAKGTSVETAEKAIRILSSPPININVTVGWIMFDALVTKKELVENVSFIVKNNILHWMSAPLNKIRVYDWTLYKRLIQNKERHLGRKLIGSFDLDTISYPVINYECSEVKMIADLSDSFFQSYYTFFYTLKSKVRFLGEERLHKYRYLRGYLSRFKELELHLLYELTTISSEELENSDVQASILEKIFKKRDYLIQEMVDDIEKRGDIDFLGKIIQEGKKLLEKNRTQVSSGVINDSNEYFSPLFTKRNKSVMPTSIQRARTPGTILRHIAVAKQKLRISHAWNDPEEETSKVIQVGAAMLNPTSMCNLKCSYCDHIHGRLIYPYEELYKLVRLAPGVVELMGGGEPTVYKDGNKDFNDLISQIKLLLPDAEIKLFTNGVFIPEGGWQREVSWVRMSIDASTPETFFTLKGSDKFDIVLQNLKRYLMSPIPDVHVSFLFQRRNIHEAGNFIVKIKQSLDALNAFIKKEKLDRFTIQFRPVSHYAPLNASANWDAYEDAVLSEKQKKTLRNEMSDLKKRIPAFLEKQTNYRSLFADYRSTIDRGKFRCFYGLVSPFIDTTGDIYPCCIMFLLKKYAFGNIITDSDVLLARRQLYFCFNLPDYCRYHCRFYENNFAIERVIGKPAIISVDGKFVNRRKDEDIGSSSAVKLVKNIPAQNADIFLSVQEELNGRVRFDHNKKVFYLDGVDIRRKSGDIDDRGFFTGYMHIDDHIDVLYKLTKVEEYMIIPYGNLYHNSHFVAFKDGTIYYQDGEFNLLTGQAINSRIYTSLVVWQNGRKSFEKLKYTKGAKGMRDVVMLADNNEIITSRVRLSIYGQQLVKDGCEVSIDALCGQFADFNQLQQRYQHSFIGLSKGGDIVVGGQGGDRSRGFGLAIPEMARFMRVHGVFNGILLANGGDVNIQHNNKFVLRSLSGSKNTYVRNKHSAVLGIAVRGLINESSSSISVMSRFDINIRNQNTSSIFTSTEQGIAGILGVNAYARGPELTKVAADTRPDAVHQVYRHFFSDRYSSSSITYTSHPVTYCIYKIIADDMAKMAKAIGISQTHKEFKSRLRHSELFLAKIAQHLLSRQIDPDTTIRVSGHQHSRVPLPAVLRVGIFPVAANPFQWDHLLIGLKAIAEQKLDKVIYDIQSGKDKRKPLLRSTEPYRYELGKQELDIFAPFFAFSKNISPYGEYDIFRILKLNPRQKIDAFYLVGGDHYFRWAKQDIKALPDGTQVQGKIQAPQNMLKGSRRYSEWARYYRMEPAADTIQKLETLPNNNKYGFNPYMHSITPIFIQRGKPKQKIDTSLDIVMLEGVGNASATDVRNALAGQGKKEHLAYLPYAGYRYIQSHPEYKDMLINPEKHGKSSSSIALTKFIKDNRLLGILIKKDYKPEGFEVLTAMDEPFSITCFERKKDTKGNLHYHNSVQETNPFGDKLRQEFVHVLKGKIKVFVYTKEWELIDTVVLNSGDSIYLTEAHQVEFLEDTTLLEVKQGPYPSTRDEDMVINNTSSSVLYGSQHNRIIGSRAGMVGSSSKEDAVSDLTKIIDRKFEVEKGKKSYELVFLNKHFENIKKFLLKKMVFPTEVEIQLSSVCNARCFYCFGKEKRLPDLLKEKNNLKVVVDKIIQSKKVKIVKLIGSTGDPLVNGYIFYAIDVFKKSGINVRMFTNGVALNRKIIQRQSNLNSLISLDELRISLDAGSGKVINAVKSVKEKSFFEILKSIEILRNSAEQQNTNLQINISYVINDRNWQDVALAARKVREYGAHSIQYRFDFFNDTLHKERKINRLLEIALETGNRTSNFNVSVINDNAGGLLCSKCYYPYFWATIGSDGKLYPCGHVALRGTKSFGSVILTDESLEKLFGKQQAIIRNMTFPNESCEICPPVGNHAGTLMQFLEEQSKEIFFVEAFDAVCKKRALSSARSSSSVKHKKFLKVDSLKNLKKAYGIIEKATKKRIESNIVLGPISNEEVYYITSIVDFSQFPLKMIEKLSLVIDELHKKFSKMNTMQTEMLHTTLFVPFYDIPVRDITTGTPRLTKSYAQRYQRQIIDFVKDREIIYIFKGISLGPDGAIFAKGYTKDNTIFGLRRYLSGMYPDPNRKTPLLHISLARISSFMELEDFRSLYQTVLKYSDIELGEFSVSKLRMVEGFDKFCSIQYNPIEIYLDSPLLTSNIISSPIINLEKNSATDSVNSSSPMHGARDIVEGFSAKNRLYRMINSLPNYSEVHIITAGGGGDILGGIFLAVELQKILEFLNKQHIKFIVFTTNLKRGEENPNGGPTPIETIGIPRLGGNRSDINRLESSRYFYKLDNPNIYAYVKVNSDTTLYPVKEVDIIEDVQNKWGIGIAMTDISVSGKELSRDYMNMIKNKAVLTIGLDMGGDILAKYLFPQIQENINIHPERGVRSPVTDTISLEFLYNVALQKEEVVLAVSALGGDGELGKTIATYLKELYSNEAIMGILNNFMMMRNQQSELRDILELNISSEVSTNLLHRLEKIVANYNNIPYFIDPTKDRGKVEGWSVDTNLRKDIWSYQMCKLMPYPYSGQKIRGDTRTEQLPYLYLYTAFLDISKVRSKISKDVLRQISTQKSDWEMVEEFFRKTLGYITERSDPANQESQRKAREILEYINYTLKNLSWKELIERFNNVRQRYKMYSDVIAELFDCFLLCAGGDRAEDGARRLMHRGIYSLLFYKSLPILSEIFSEQPQEFSKFCKTLMTSVDSIINDERHIPEVLSVGYILVDRFIPVLISNFNNRTQIEEIFIELKNVLIKLSEYRMKPIYERAKEISSEVETLGAVDVESIKALLHDYLDRMLSMRLNSLGVDYPRRITGSVKGDIVFWKNISKGGLIYPSVIEFHPSTTCNHNCRYCYSKGFNYKNGKLLSKEKVFSILEEVARGGTKTLIISGGKEPLCNGDSLEYLKFAKEKGLRTVLLTNGEKIKDKDFSLILEKVDFIRISIDSFSEDEYCEIKGVNSHSYHRVINNIKALVQRKSTHGSKTDIGISAVVVNENCQSIGDFITRGLNDGVDFIDVRLEYTGKERYSEEALEFFSALEKDYKNNKKVRFTQERADFCRCFANICWISHYKPTIDPFGNIYPCCSLAHPGIGDDSVILGNINDASEFIEVWVSTLNKRFSIIPQKCEFCAYNDKAKNELLDKFLTVPSEIQNKISSHSSSVVKIDSIDKLKKAIRIFDSYSTDDHKFDAYLIGSFARYLLREKIVDTRDIDFAIETKGRLTAEQADIFEFINRKFNAEDEKLHLASFIPYGKIYKAEGDSIIDTMRIRNEGMYEKLAPEEKKKFVLILIDKGFKLFINKLLINNQSISISSNSASASPLFCNIPEEEHALKIEFGTSGWRGKIGQDFNLWNVRRCAQGLANYYQDYIRKGGILVGFDPREGNYQFAREIASILAANRIPVEIVIEEPTPSPVLAYLANSNPGISGVVNLTASHNKYSDNGFKFSPYHGGAADKQTTDKISEYANRIEGYRTVDYNRAKENGLIREVPLEKVIKLYVGDYIIPVLKDIDAWDAIVNYVKKNSAFRVILDPMQGTSSKYLQAIFDELESSAGRSFYKIIHSENKDPHFSRVNGAPNPTESVSIKDALELTRGNNNTIALLTDGDADRFGLIDFGGNEINANNIIAALSHFLAQKGFPGAVGKTVATSNFVNAVAEYNNLPLIETAVGFKWTVEKTIKENVSFLVGGEESAHVGIQPFFKSWDDGIAISLACLWVIADTNKSFSRYIESLENTIGKKFYYNRDNIPLTPELKQQASELIAQSKQEKELPLARKSITKQIAKISPRAAVAEVITLDGLKVVDREGNWFCIRLSGTEDVSRLYSEGVNAKQAQQNLHNIVNSGDTILNSKAAVSFSRKPVLIDKMSQLAIAKDKELEQLKQLNKEIFNNKAGWSNEVKSIIKFM